jgi:hypothetical protein
MPAYQITPLGAAIAEAKSEHAQPHQRQPALTSNEHECEETRLPKETRERLAMFMAGAESTAMPQARRSALDHL